MFRRRRHPCIARASTTMLSDRRGVQLSVRDAGGRCAVLQRVRGKRAEAAGPRRFEPRSSRMLMSGKGDRGQWSPGDGTPAPCPSTGDRRIDGNAVIATGVISAACDAGAPDNLSIMAIHDIGLPHGSPRRRRSSGCRWSRWGSAPRTTVSDRRVSLPSAWLATCTDLESTALRAPI